jgi:hypothetical protein
VGPGSSGRQAHVHIYPAPAAATALPLHLQQQLHASTQPVMCLRYPWCLQVPFLSRECEAVHGQAVVLEALQALYNICFFHKRVHLEVAASSGIVPHLCRWPLQGHCLSSARHAPWSWNLALLDS